MGPGLDSTVEGTLGYGETDRPYLGIDLTSCQSLKKKRFSLTSYLNHASNLESRQDGGLF